MLNFIFHSIIFLFAGFPVMAIYGVGVMVCIAPAVFLLDKDKPNWLAAIPIYLLAGVYNLFFWGLWASFCIIVTIVFIQKSSVRFDWIY